MELKDRCSNQAELRRLKQIVASDTSRLLDGRLSGAVAFHR